MPALESGADHTSEHFHRQPDFRVTLLTVRGSGFGVRGSGFGVHGSLFGVGISDADAIAALP
ncbi:MAG: hypothetical protein JO151_01570 [Verrucomicrobia bacterium]|nr:hypothetical protein [Verrucomicrobiota bacterium]